ncbi:hypothetical protein [Dietzia psychralcaliphila]
MVDLKQFVEGPSAIARDLGVGRSTLYRALHRHTP